MKKAGIYQIILYIFFGLVSITMLYPFWHTFIGSIITYEEYVRKSFFLFPDNPTLEAYKFIIAFSRILSPMKTTVFITVVGTLVSLFFTAFFAYGMSKKFPGASLFMMLVVITMFVDPGLIPSYMLMRSLGLMNKIAIYIIPALCNTFFMIVMRTHFLGFSREIEESARIDGCGELRIFLQFVLPLSKATLATIGLFYAVGYWNTFFPSLFFITDYNKKTLQDYLYMVITNTDMDESGQILDIQLFTESVKLANVILTVLPILFVYPFLQKHFVKGIMIGSVKG